MLVKGANGVTWLQGVKFVPNGPNDSKSVLVQIVAQHQLGAQPLSGSVVPKILNTISYGITMPQQVNVPVLFTYIKGIMFPFQNMTSI